MVTRLQLTCTSCGVSKTLAPASLDRGGSDQALPDDKGGLTVVSCDSIASPLSASGELRPSLTCSNDEAAFQSDMAAWRSHAAIHKHETGYELTGILCQMSGKACDVAVGASSREPLLRQLPRSRRVRKLCTPLGLPCSMHCSRALRPPIPALRLQLCRP